MSLNIFILFVLFQFFHLTREKTFNVISTTPRSSDLQRLTEIVADLERRIEFSETLKESNKKLSALEWQIIQIQNTLNSMNSQVSTIEQKLEKLTASKDSTCGKTSLPTSCKDVQRKGRNVSGIYLIHPEYSLDSFMVFCDMESRGGGWTYFLNRFDGSQNFHLNWTDYKKGFGSLSGEFWLGLEALHQLTGYEANELLVELKDFENNTVYALYNAFVIGSEEEGYPLKVLGTYSGNAGDSFHHHAGMKFTTRDRDQDLRSYANCALQEQGAWWYKNCTASNLCATYYKGYVPNSDRWKIMYWKDFRGSNYSLKEARMMVKPRTKYSTTILRQN